MNPSRRDLFHTLAAPIAAASMQAATPNPPNVLLILTDDQGYGDLGCHGNQVLKTPDLDAFHDRSVRFTNFHVSPTCAPTRAALMTGRFSNATGVWHTIMGRSLLRPGEVTMADCFRASGYRTGIFGKWHLGDNYPCRPQDRGLDETAICGGGGVWQTPDYFGNDYFDDTYRHNGKPVKSGMIANLDRNMARMQEFLVIKGLTENTIVVFACDNGTAEGARVHNANMRTPCAVLHSMAQRWIDGLPRHRHPRLAH